MVTRWYGWYNVLSECYLGMRFFLFLSLSCFSTEYYFFTLTLEKPLHQLWSLYLIFYQYILLYFPLKILIEMVVASKHTHVISSYYFFPIKFLFFFFQIITISNSLLFFFSQSHNTFSVNFVIFLGFSLINLSWIFETNSGSHPNW